MSCLLGALALAKAQTIYDACRAALGDSELAVPVAEMGVAAAVFLLPTIFMGMTFSCIVQAARRAEGGVGRTAALNTCGGALASALFGVVLLPLIGSKWTLVVISLGYLALAPRFNNWRWGFLAGAIALIFATPASVGANTSRLRRRTHNSWNSPQWAEPRPRPHGLANFRAAMASASTTRHAPNAFG